MLRKLCWTAASLLWLLSDLGTSFNTIASFQLHNDSFLSSRCATARSPFIAYTKKSRSVTPLLLASGNKDNEEDFDFEKASEDGSSPVIFRGDDTDDIDGSLWEDLETGRPPQWMVMKELLGINIFTYALGGLIVFFLGMNVFLGPGWLGSVFGMSGTGSINEVSDSFPGTVDLSSPEFRL